MKIIKNYGDTKNEITIYQLRLETLKETITFLEKEIQDIHDMIADNCSYLEQMENCLKELHGYEYKLYYEIVVNNLNVTRAVDKVALMVDRDPSTIWKNVYPKVKSEIEKIQNSSD